MDIVTRQSLVSQAATNDLGDARRLCQSGAGYPKACRALPEETKTKLCLGDNDAAQECDKVPMYSKNQFFALIPAQIEIFADEPLQLHHEFYSRKYKLATEGFAQALYKARVLNTIIALSRPQILLQYADGMPPLPSYVDASLADELISAYKAAIDDHAKNPAAPIEFETHIMGFPLGIHGVSARISLYFNTITSKMDVELTILTKADYVNALSRVEDAFITDRFKLRVLEPLPGMDQGYTIEYIRLGGSQEAPNPFILSRVLYDLLNKGFLGWELTTYYKVGGNRQRINISI